MAKIHGAASAGETLGGNINFYTLYVSGLDITATGNVADQTQQNFDDVVNLISLVAQPIIMNNPIGVNRLFAIIVGFLGALLIVKPEFGELNIYMILPIICAFTYSLSMIYGVLFLTIRI